jgi:hypothetical protein
MSTVPNAPASPSSTPAKKPDRSTAPMLGVLAACIASAYGFTSESALWRWGIPLALVASGFLWAFRPGSRRAAP